MNDAEWEEAIDMIDTEDIDILDWHYQEECKDQEIDDLHGDLEFYSDWIDELEDVISIKERYILELEEQVAKLEEKLENQKKVILSLRNKNSQLIGDIRELLDEKPARTCEGCRDEFYGDNCETCIRYHRLTDCYKPNKED